MQSKISFNNSCQTSEQNPVIVFDYKPIKEINYIKGELHFLQSLKNSSAIGIWKLKSLKK